MIFWPNDAMAGLNRQLFLMINLVFFTAINPKHFLGAPFYQCFDSISNDVNLTKSNVARFVKGRQVVPIPKWRRKIWFDATT